MDVPDYLIINPLQIELFIPELKLDNEIDISEEKEKQLKYKIQQIDHKIILIEI
jgi:hypothetical protein